MKNHHQKHSMWGLSLSPSYFILLAILFQTPLQAKETKKEIWVEMTVKEKPPPPPPPPEEPPPEPPPEKKNLLQSPRKRR